MRGVIFIAAVCAASCAPRGRRVPCPEVAAGRRAAALPADAPWFDHASTLIGTVTAAGTGRPLVGAEVALARGVPPDTQVDRRARVRTDSAGGFVMIGGSGAMTVSVHAPGYRRADTVVTLATERVDTLRVALQLLPCRAGGP